MIVHVTERALEAVEQVIIVTRTKKREIAYKNVVSRFLGNIDRVAICSDIPGLPMGPLTGITTALRELEGTSELPITAVVLPVDVPFVKPKLIAAMIRGARRAEVAVPTWSTGAIEPLMQGLNVLQTITRAISLSAMGRVRPDDLVRSARNAVFLSIEDDLRAFDPHLESFVNINTPEDLKSRKPRTPTGEKALTGTEIISLNKYGPRFELASSDAKELGAELDEIGSASLFWRGLLAWQLNRLTRDREALVIAAESFEEEGRQLSSLHLRTLAAHAYVDAARCWAEVPAPNKAEEDEIKAAELLATAGIKPPAT